MLTVEGDYPVCVASAGGEFPAAAGTHTAANQAVLRALNFLELGRHTGADDKDTEAAADLARVEAKLDLLIGMIAEWFVGQSPLPPVRHVTLSAGQIAIVDVPQWPHGERVRVDLYPSTQLPRPLRFACTVVDVVPVDDRPVLALRIEHPDKAASDEFERYLFLLHRRLHGRRARRPG